MPSASYQARRDEIENYFDQNGCSARLGRRLTSDAPVSRIRRTVRRGRDAMRADAVELAARGPDAVARCSTPGAARGNARDRGGRGGAPRWSQSIYHPLWSSLRQRAICGTLGQSLDVTFLVGDMRDMDLGCPSIMPSPWTR